jgi:hypothetical protein
VVFVISPLKTAPARGILKPKERDGMESANAKILPPTEEEIEIARQDLYAKLERAERQPLSEKRSAKEVFAESRARLEALLNAKRV